MHCPTGPTESPSLQKIWQSEISTGMRSRVTQVTGSTRCVCGGEGGACEGGLRGERHRTDVKRSLQCLQEITDGCCMSMAAVKWRQGVTLESGGKSNILLHLTHTNKDPPPCCTCPWLLSIFTAPLYNKFTGKNLAYVLSALPHLSLLNPTPISKLPLSTTCTGANPQVRFRSMYLTTP